MGILLGLNAVLWIAGFLLPVPMSLLAWRGWLKTRNTPPSKSWRRKMSQIGVCLLTIGLALWDLGADLFESLTARVGTLGAALLIIPSALAENRVRIWLIFGTLGLLFFFGVSTGEVAIQLESRTCYNL
jgi:hypothetical protein